MHEHILGSDGCGWVGARLVIFTEAILLPCLPLCNGSGHTVFLDPVVAHNLKVKQFHFIETLPGGGSINDKQGLQHQTTKCTYSAERNILSQQSSDFFLLSGHSINEKEQCTKK